MLRALARLFLIVGAFVALVIFFSIEYERANTPDDHGSTFRVGTFAPWLEIDHTDRRVIVGESPYHGRQLPIYESTYGTSIRATAAWSALGILGFAFLALEKRLRRAAAPR